MTDGIAIHLAFNNVTLCRVLSNPFGAMFLRLFLVLMGICGAVRQAWTSKKESVQRPMWDRPDLGIVLQGDG